MRHLPAIALSLALVLPSCQSKAPVARVEAPPPVTVTAVTATAPQCLASGDSPEEFVIDWPFEKRGDLEIALKRKTIVMSVTCSSAKILPDCSADGAYSFIGLTEHEELLSLRSVDEVRGNLPQAATALSAVDFQHGASVDIAIATAGRRSSSRVSVSRSDLKGECDGATHFVRAATLGAFALGTGAPGQKKVLADLFGGAAGATTKDGSLDACRTASSAAEKETAQCGAPLRVTLKAIKGAAPAASADRSAALNANSDCPAGMVQTESGACQTPSSDRPHICNFANIAECTEQCDRGSPTSCSILGRSYQLGRGVQKDLSRATEFLTKACAGAAYPACGRLGEMALDAHEEEKGLALLAQACDGGWVDGCVMAGTYLVDNVLKKSPAKGANVAEIFRRACLGGQPEGCWGIGSLYLEGHGGFPTNDKEAAKWLSLACEGNAMQGCADYAVLMDTGRGGVSADPAGAVALLVAACESARPVACARLAEDYFHGHVVAQDSAKGMKLLERGCSLGNAPICDYAARHYWLGTDGVTMDPKKAAPLFEIACQTGFKGSCPHVVGANTAHPSGKP